MSTRLALAVRVLAVGTLMSACGDEPGAETQVGDVAGVLAENDVAELVLADDPSEQESFTLRPKMNVSNIVLERYGSRHYSRMVLLHNDIKDASRLPVGKVIKTPDLGEILKEEAGLYRRAKGELEALLELRRAFMSLEAELTSLVEAAPDRMQMTVPSALGAQLRELSKRLEGVGENLSKEREDTKKSPTKMIASVFEAAAILEQLAAGEMMDEKFGVGQIHKRLGNAFADAMIWARVERR
jgi:hypothetical protein